MDSEYIEVSKNRQNSVIMRFIQGEEGIEKEINIISYSKQCYEEDQGADLASDCVFVCVCERDRDLGKVSLRKSLMS